MTPLNKISQICRELREPRHESKSLVISPGRRDLVVGNDLTINVFSWVFWINRWQGVLYISVSFFLQIHAEMVELFKHILRMVTEP